MSLPLTAFATEGATEPTEITNPTEETVPTVDQLRIDGTNLYEGMENTYEKGYIPKVSDGKVSIILPLLGKTYDSKVTVTADLGATNENPCIVQSIAADTKLR